MTIDKNELYGQFDSSHKRRQRLAELATRKALDLPLDDDMNIINNRQGASMMGTALLSAALLLGGGGLGVGIAGLAGMGGADKPASPVVPAMKPDSGPAPTPVEPQEFKVTFWGDDSQPIQVKSHEQGEKNNDN